jgi:hypothetical protein
VPKVTFFGFSSVPAIDSLGNIDSSTRSDRHGKNSYKFENASVVTEFNVEAFPHSHLRQKSFPICCSAMTVSQGNDEASGQKLSKIGRFDPHQN